MTTLETCKQDLMNTRTLISELEHDNKLQNEVIDTNVIAIGKARLVIEESLGYKKIAKDKVIANSKKLRMYKLNLKALSRMVTEGDKLQEVEDES